MIRKVRGFGWLSIILLFLSVVGGLGLGTAITGDRGSGMIVGAVFVLVGGALNFILGILLNRESASRGFRHADHAVGGLPMQYASVASIVAALMMFVVGAQG